MDWPKRARVAAFGDGVLTLDGKQYDLAAIDMDAMEHLASYTLVGLNIKGAPITVSMLQPFVSHKSMVNFGIEDGCLTDECFSIFASMPKLRILLLDGNLGINGSCLDALQESKLDLITLNRTSLNDAGMTQAALCSKFSHIQIDNTKVSLSGLLSLAVNTKMQVVSHTLFNDSELEQFYQLQREHAKTSRAAKRKNKVKTNDLANEQTLATVTRHGTKDTELKDGLIGTISKSDEAAILDCERVLSAFFVKMTAIEHYMESNGFDDANVIPMLNELWNEYVSEKPRLGFRPLVLSFMKGGTYGHEIVVDSEKITRNKFYIYTKDTLFGAQRRFLMKRTENGFKIDLVQERFNGWQRVGL